MTRRVCFFCLQQARSNNPNISSDITIVAVQLDPEEPFDLDRAEKGEYTFWILGGQHINHCDWELLAGVYHGKTQADIPPNVFWKTCQVYKNLTPDERAQFVLTHNAKIQLVHSNFEKVRLK